MINTGCFLLFTLSEKAPQDNIDSIKFFGKLTVETNRKFKVVYYWKKMKDKRKTLHKPLEVSTQVNFHSRIPATESKVQNVQSAQDKFLAKLSRKVFRITKKCTTMLTKF